MSQVVLVVDDDPVQRRLIENMVQRFGYQAVTAEGGDAAAKLVCGPDGARFACMILDLVMPDLDGMGVLERMKDAGRSMPVIVQTAHGGIDNVVSAMRAGAVDFVATGRRAPLGAPAWQLAVNIKASVAVNKRFTRIPLLAALIPYTQPFGGHTPGSVRHQAIAGFGATLV